MAQEPTLTIVPVALELKGQDHVAYYWGDVLTLW